MTLLVPFALAALWAGANPPLDEAREHARGLRFQKAIVKLKVAKTVPTSTEAERREVLRLLAECHAALGANAEATAAYEELVTAEPRFELSEDASPKLLELFRAAKERVYPKDFVGLEELPSPPGQLLVRVVDPWARVAALVVAAGAKEQPVSLEGDRARLDAGPRPEGASLEARDAQGKRLAALKLKAGQPAPEAAVSVKTEAPAPKPPSSLRFVGYGVGAASVAAAAAGGYFALSSSRLATDARRREPGEPGHFASDAIALNARAGDDGRTATFLLGGAAVGAAAAVTLLVAF